MPPVTAKTNRLAAPSPAPAKRTPAPAGPAPSPSGPPAVRLGGAPAKDGEAAPGVLELKGMAEFKPPASIAEFLDARKTSTVNTRFGNLAQGPIEVRTAAKGKYRIRKQPIPLSHPAFARVAEFTGGLTPALVISVSGNKLEGKVGLAKGKNTEDLAHHIQKTPDLLGLAGFSIGQLPTPINKLEGGSMHFGLNGVKIKLGSAFSGTFNFVLVDAAVSFDGNVAIVVGGLANGNLELKRANDGLITGKVAIAVKLSKNLSGTVDVAWDGTAITGLGKVGYTGEKFSGEVTLQMMEKNQAMRLAEAKQAPEGTAPKPAAAAEKKPANIAYVVFGEGDLAFSFTEWLSGTAHVIIDPKGNLTVIGKITPQKEFILFEQKDYVKQLFKLEARASYGIPVVGSIGIFGNASMDLFAKLGPAKFYNIVVDGTYSTDPKVAKNFTIRGSLNISAAAGARLRAEVGAVLTILAHDIKAGAGVNGIAGVKAYAEATPIIGYREKAAEGQDKKGEWFIRGDLEVAAQPFIGLSGDLFVEIDAPWWSPVPDKKWTWPMFNKEWPLDCTMGMLVSVDYVFGSGQWPKFDFKPVSFDSSKFMSNLYEDKAKSGPGKELQQKGKWGEKNSAASEAPAKTSPKGNAAPGKTSAMPAAKSKPLAGKKGDKTVDPNAKTKEGKTVKQLQDDATKKGKKPEGHDAKGGKGSDAAKDKGMASERWERGVTAVKQALVYAEKNGISEGELNKILKSVKKRKEYSFTELKAKSENGFWIIEGSMSPGKQITTVKAAGPSTGQAGSKGKPFEIVWPKRKLADYKPIWLVPESVANGKVYSQKELEAMPGAQKYSPKPLKKLFGSDEIGVTRSWETYQNRVFEAAPHKGRSDKQKARFNSLLEKHGYDRTRTDEGTTDGDHVSELQVASALADIFPNLWPLNSSENRSSGSTLSQTKVELDDGSKVAIRDLDQGKYWFKIIKFSR